MIGSLGVKSFAAESLVVAIAIPIFSYICTTMARLIISYISREKSRHVTVKFNRALHSISIDAGKETSKKEINDAVKKLLQDIDNAGKKRDAF